jgi:CRP/FNR family cyclic AMP-dependent transcriptional regulator
VELVKLLQSVEMFAGLSEAQLNELVSIFETHRLDEGEVLFSQGDEASDLFLVSEGFVEVIHEEDDSPEGKILVNLGPGQSVGEMALVDQGTRSATIRSASDNTVVISVSREDFERFCEGNTEIGYRVMRNIAADLSFRLRRRNV